MTEPTYTLQYEGGGEYSGNLSSGEKFWITPSSEGCGLTFPHDNSYYEFSSVSKAERWLEDREFDIAEDRAIERDKQRNELMASVVGRAA